LLPGEDVLNHHITEDNQFILIETKLDGLEGGRLFSYQLSTGDVRLLHKELNVGEYIVDYKRLGNVIIYRWLRDGKLQLYRSNLNGTNLVRLHEDLSEYQNVGRGYKFSYNGQWILFDLNDQDIARPSIYRVPVQ
jgi:hypothetical protein